MPNRSVQGAGHAVALPACAVNPLEKVPAFQFEGGTVIELCHQKSPRPNSLHFPEHSFLFLEEGEFHIHSPGVVIRKGEAVFIRRASYIDYRKFPSPDGAHCTGILFTFSESILRDFLKFRPVETAAPSISSIFKIAPAVDLWPFIRLLKAYLESPLAKDAEIIRLKVWEILLVLIRSNPEIAPNLFGFLERPTSNLVPFMAANFTKPLRVSEFAYLSGRSLSKFKRDFREAFQAAPTDWLRAKRLEFAHRLLTTTDLSVTRTCYESGFEDVAHFSRTFKSAFGQSPSTIKKEPPGQNH